MAVKLACFAVVLLTAVLVAASPVNARQDTANGGQKPARTPERPNSLMLSGGRFFIRKTDHNKGPVEQIGIRYSRKIYKSLFAGIRYAEWNSLFASRFGNENRRIYEERSYFVANPYIPESGQLEGRTAYRMIDLELNSSICRFGRDNIVRAGLAFSYCWGENEILEYYVQTALDSRAKYYNIPATYLGVCPSLAYERLFFSGRMKLGVEYLYRYYPKRIKAQRDISLSVSVNL